MEIGRNILVFFLLLNRHWNNKAYLANQRKKKGHIPDDVYFNAKGMQIHRMIK